MYLRDLVVFCLNPEIRTGREGNQKRITRMGGVFDLGKPTKRAHKKRAHLGSAAHLLDGHAAIQWLWWGLPSVHVLGGQNEAHGPGRFFGGIKGGRRG